MSTAKAGVVEVDFPPTNTLYHHLTFMSSLSPVLRSGRFTGSVRGLNAFNERSAVRRDGAGSGRQGVVPSGGFGRVGVELWYLSARVVGVRLGVKIVGNRNYGVRCADRSGMVVWWY